MARFTVRVQLHKKNGKQHELDSETYEILHSEMKKEGFTKTIHSSKGTTHNLPTAEYSFIDSDNTKDKYDILKIAKIAAIKTEEKYSILVTMSFEGRCWCNLDESEDNEDE